MEYKFSDLFKWTSGKPISPSDGQIPIYGSNGIIGYTSQAKFNNKIILGRVGAYCGSVAYCKDGFNATDNTLITTCNEGNIIYSYAYYLLKSFNLNNFASGAAQPLITQSILKRLKCDIPNVYVQHRIASILSTYDTLIENNTKRIRLLEKMAENLYKEWFVRFRFPGHENVEMENGLPKGWKVEKLSHIACIIMGQSPESKYYNDNKEGLPFHQGVGSYGEFYVVDNIYSTMGKKIVEPFTIIFSVRAPVGRINITLNRVILGRGLAGINEKRGYNSFLLWCLKEKFAKEDAIGNGSIFTSVTKDELFKQKLTVPEERILKKFNAIAHGFEEEIRILTRTNTLLARQRDLLLPRLMSGKLEVKP